MVDAMHNTAGSLPKTINRTKQTVKNMIADSENLVFTKNALLALIALEDTSVLECLLSEPGLRNQINISPRMLEVAASSRSALKTMEILFLEFRNEIQINEKLILFVLKNTWPSQTLEVMKLIFTDHADEVRVTERVLE